MMRVRLIKMADMTDTLLMICGNSTPQFKCADLNVRQEMDMVLELFEILKPYAKVSFHITPGGCFGLSGSGLFLLYGGQPCR